ncbi:hypothetical protein PQE74_gp096 [Bacillus phage vB_BanS_Chewbecca]|uniref:Uncharacterized protein n=1 Tax=Bacillus phage vB_BanS_Chewbecca TaxID=2894786 RepID=A0AAE8YMR1_9CAUD|nr:hypothetical protein PQE74_gp096 [Bacillus phage vB_BanS_Chewbecca]UGO46179.1 hypothetical protein CHEWBECCA_96 [Bacillus phage vB_BanS_Chewbecca]
MALAHSYYGLLERDCKMSTIEDIRKYIEGMKDDNGIYHIHGEAESLLVDALEHLEVKIDRLSEAESLLSEAHDLMDDVHCYDTDTYRAITKYFYGDDE